MIMQYHRYYVINVRHTYVLYDYDSGIVGTKCNLQSMCAMKLPVSNDGTKVKQEQHTNKNAESLWQLARKKRKQRWMNHWKWRENCEWWTIPAPNVHRKMEQATERWREQINKSIEIVRPLSLHILDGWCILNNALFSWPFSFLCVSAHCKTHSHTTFYIQAVDYHIPPIELEVAQESIIKTTKCNRDIKTHKCTHRAKVENQFCIFFFSFDFLLLGRFFLALSHSISLFLSINFQWKNGSTHTHVENELVCASSLKRGFSCHHRLFCDFFLLSHSLYVLFWLCSIFYSYKKYKASSKKQRTWKLIIKAREKKLFVLFQRQREHFWAKRKMYGAKKFVEDRTKLAPVYCCAFFLSKVKHAQYFLCVL